MFCCALFYSSPSGLLAMLCLPPLSGYSPSRHFFIWPTVLFWRDVHPLTTGDLFLDVSLVPQQHEPSTYSGSPPSPGYWRGLLATFLVLRTVLSEKASSMGMWEGSFQSSHLTMSPISFQILITRRMSMAHTALPRECLASPPFFFLATIFLLHTNSKFSAMLNFTVPWKHCYVKPPANMSFSGADAIHWRETIYLFEAQLSNGLFDEAFGDHLKRK